MKSTTVRIFGLLAGGLCLLLLAGFAILSDGRPVDERAYVPANQVRDAIEAATARQPGQIGGVYVESEGQDDEEDEDDEDTEDTEEDGTSVEVVVRDDGGSVHTVEVNAASGTVLEVEDGAEEHHEMEEEEEEDEYEEDGM